MRTGSLVDVLVHIPSGIYPERFDSISFFGRWRGVWGGSRREGTPKGDVMQIATVDDGSFIPRGTLGAL